MNVKGYLKYLIGLAIILLIGGLVYYRQYRMNNDKNMERVEFTMLDRGYYGLYGQIVTDPKNADAKYKDLSVWVIDNDVDWKKFWEQDIRQPDTGGFKSAPIVDFKTRYVVAILQGIKTSGGYFVSTNEVRQNESKILLKTAITEPQGTDAQTQIITSPYEVVTLPKKDGKINTSAKLVVENQQTGKTVFSQIIEKLLNKKI